MALRMVDLSDEFKPTRYNLKGQEIQSFGFRFINKLRTNHKEGSYCKIKRKKKTNSTSAVRLILRVRQRRGSSS